MQEKDRPLATSAGCENGYDDVRGSIVLLLGFGRRDVADGFEQPAMVEPVDPFQAYLTASKLRYGLRGGSPRRPDEAREACRGRWSSRL
jgi:hypothetical protein